MKTSFTSVEEYIATFPEETRKLLQEIRAVIKAAAPNAEEKISYNIPTLTLDGKYLVYFAGWKNHISIYPIPPGSDTFDRQISKYADGKGTLKFPLDKPLPLKLIRQVVNYRLEELKHAKTKYGR